MVKRDDLNLDAFGNSNNSLDNLPKNGITQPQFDAQMDWSIINTPRLFDGAVTNAKLGNFTFNKGTGGSLTLGGTSNGNGQLLIRDSLGSIIVQGDNTGLAVYNGSISIQNSSGSSVVDSFGLNSLQSFPSDGTFINPSLTTTSTSFGSVPSSALTMVLGRSSKVLLSVYAEATNDIYYSNGDYCEVKWLGTSDGGTNSITTPFYGNWAGNLNANWSTFGGGGTVYGLSITFNLQNSSQGIGLSKVFTFPAGTTTLFGQFRSANGGTSFLSTYSLSYVLLGK